MDAGARRVAASVNAEHSRVKAPRDRPELRVFIRPQVRAALDALRHADQHRSRREWVAGEPEWRNSRELTAWLKTRRAGGRTPRIHPSAFIAPTAVLIAVRIAANQISTRPAMLA